MKKLQFKAQFMNNGERTLYALNGEEYDEFTYYTSKRMNAGLKYPISPYCLYDKNTGLTVACGNSKQELFEKYKAVTDRYAKCRNSNEYSKIIEQYEQLKEKHNDL